ncbi:la-related protein 6A isoform X1 [Physcomitrium patens]|uniref:HTH La-type RNA-binding domain-containing protein n=1 Tax=Physcomitrium patens TaxID=3218 RepID=A0A2K1LA96_PHYPA|nr:la-related protein 6A-like [Physcomitrium patens]PNR62952.1 hypothetical protein PHYPA_001377 [Physcomitrium patens]|eukprot:XP_024374414.1 la-related protein 6A-like [Physcomitrella patens]
MAPSAASSAEHHRRSTFGVVDAAPMVVAVTTTAPSVAPSKSTTNQQNQHHHHPNRAGAPLSALSMLPSGMGTPPMDVVGHRRTFSTSSAHGILPQVVDDISGNNEKKVHLLSRSLSGSTLNAGAPEFVPKGLQIAFSTSLPGPGLAPGLGLSPPSLIQSPSSVIPVITPPPSVAIASVAEFGPTVEEHISVSPTSIDQVPAKDGTDTTDCTDVVPAGEHSSKSDQAQPGATAVAQPTKPVLTEETKAKIVKQVEFYFSDTNLPTDNYLMKFVKKDSEGFVPIPVVASFRKIKNLVKNHGVLAATLRNSTQLVVSEDGKKVRRAHPLPEVDLEEIQARTVVAENLPEDHSIESLEQLFGKVGTVKMVRICSPEAANGANATGAKHPKTDMLVSNKLHALVEYETVELAEKAVAELTDERNWRSGLRVRLLLRRQFQGKHNYQQAPHQRTRKPSMDNVDLAMEEEEGEKLDKSGDKTHDKGSEELAGQHHHADRGEDNTGESGDQVGKKGRGRGRGGRAGGGGRGRGQQFYNTHSGTPPRDNSLHLVSELVGKPPPGPRMPDGTRGFSTGRGKTLAVNTAVNSMA